MSSLLPRLFKRPTFSGQSRRQHPALRRLHIEVLEDRTVPSTLLVSRSVDDNGAGTLRYAVAHAHNGEDPIDSLFDQLRQRRLAEEQKETFSKQQEAAARLKELNEAQAVAARQTHLTETQIEIQVSANRGAAQLAEAERLAKREVAMAEGQARVAELTGHGEALRGRSAMNS